MPNVTLVKVKKHGIVLKVKKYKVLNKDPILKYRRIISYIYFKYEVLVMQNGSFCSILLLYVLFYPVLYM